MKGGFNKILRNVVAGSSDTEFEKRLCKATFQLDSKEPKEKHVIFLLESLNGEHKEQVSPIGALKFILERHISNLDNWAINMKVLIIIHRSLQNIRVNRKIIKDLKKNEHLLHPYQKKNPENKYNVKMYMEITKQYSTYIKFYMNTCLKTDMLTKPRKKLSDEVRTLRTSDILRNYEFFEGMCTQIFTMFQHTNFCKQTRLFSNFIFMLLKDLMEIYRIYYNHITEVLERFPTLGVNEVQKAFVMYQNFVNLTEAIKNKANKLIYIFNFPITLPDFYNPEKGLIDTLRVVVNAAKDDATGAGQQIQEVSSKLRAGMNREQYTDKKDEEGEGIEKFYFDCNVLEKIEGQQEEQYIPEEVNQAEELKMDKNLDLFEYITNLDIGDGSGQGAQQPKPQQQEEQKQSPSFDFENFAKGGDGNPNKQEAPKQQNDFFNFNEQDAQARQNSKTEVQKPADSLNELFDVFNAPAQKPAEASQQDLNDIFGASASQPLSSGRGMSQPQGPPQSKVDVLGSFYTNQNQGQQPMMQQQFGGNQFQTQAVPGTDPFSAAEQNQQQQQQPGFQSQGGFQPMPGGGNPFGGNQFQTGWGSNPAAMQQMQMQQMQQQQMMMQMQNQPQMQQNQQNQNQRNDFFF